MRAYYIRLLIVSGAKDDKYGEYLGKREIIHMGLSMIRTMYAQATGLMTHRSKQG